MTAMYHTETFVKSCAKCGSSFTTMISELDKCAECRSEREMKPAEYIRPVEIPMKCHCCDYVFPKQKQMVDESKPLLCDKCYEAKSKMFTKSVDVRTDAKMEVEYQRCQIYCQEHQSGKKVDYQEMYVTYGIPTCLKLPSPAIPHSITVQKLLELETTHLKCGCRIIYIVVLIRMLKQ